MDFWSSCLRGHVPHVERHEMTISKNSLDSLSGSWIIREKRLY